MRRKRHRSPPLSLSTTDDSADSPSPPPAKVANHSRRYLSARDVAPDQQLELVVEQWAPAGADPDSGVAAVVRPTRGPHPRRLNLLRGDVSSAFGAGLAPKPGDRIRLTASRSDSDSSPRAVSISDCKLLHLVGRSQAEWLVFVRHLLDVADNSPHPGQGHLSSELGDPPTVVWHNLLGDVKPNSGVVFNVELSGALCRLLALLARLLASRSRRHLEFIIDAACSQKVLCRLLKPLIEAEAAESIDSLATPSIRRILIEFTRAILAREPNCLARLLPLLRGATPPSSSLLLDLLTAVAELRPGGRRSISIAPTTEDLAAGRSSMLTGLQAAKLKGSYESVEDYFETMFRLLRADCFEKFYECMDQVRSGRRSRDIDIRVYYNVKVRSIKLIKSGACIIGVTFQLEKSDQSPKNWAKSMRLMTGNLLCLATSDQFNEHYWATVSDRDSQTLNSERLVWLELCQYMCSPDTSAGDVLANLLLNSTSASNGLIMLESPTLFSSFEPVLESLKCFDADKFPFADALVFGDMASAEALPLYVKRHYQDDEGNADNNADKLPFISTGNLQLDVCQSSALENALHRRIYVCQGPPGTGKTLLGVLIAKQLLELDVLENRPILVLCYKNHALDEFLSHLLPDHQDKIVRIGGRCKEPRLEHLNLFKLRQTYSDPGRWKSIRQVVVRIKEAWHQLKNSLQQLDLLFAHPAVAILDECEERHLAELIRKRNRKENQKQKIRNRKSFKGRLQPEEREVEDTLNRASKDELLDLIRSDDTLLSALAACIDRSMPAIDARLQAGRAKTQAAKKNSAQQQPAAASSSSIAENAVAADYLDDADEEEVKERENHIFAGRKFRSDKSRSKPIDQIYFDRINASRILYEPSMENFCNSGLIAHLSEKNPTRLSPTEQMLYFQQALYKAIKNVRDDIKRQFECIQQLESEKRLIEVKADAAILRGRRIIGMTITGASIHRELLDLVQPAVLLVEEAAEVSEPHLLACFGHRTEHLILIGDHKQLRPQTESYKLAKDYHLDVSMMERLIANGIKYDQLELQSRMRPEFSFLLKDIYPNLRDNLAVVSRELEPRCFASPMFFWTHGVPETRIEGHHGAINKEEAQRCVQLAVFLIIQGCDPARITILSAYSRQTALIRQLYKDFLAKHEFLNSLIQQRWNQSSEDESMSRHEESDMRDDFQTRSSNFSPPEADVSVKIFTIDLYQGDENDIVIVSLVRSNPLNNIGFLQSLNRRCVAQSRARLAMVFIGNADCIYDSRNGKIWRPLIDAMRDLNFFGTRISLRCPNHALSEVHAESYEQIPVMTSFCREICGIQMSCQVHSCLLPCQPSHDRQHEVCKAVVPFVYAECGHSDTKFCSEPISMRTCKTKVPMKFADCSHSTMKECGISDSFYKCHQPCERLLACGHKCLLKCYDLCAKTPCQEIVPLEFPCGHSINTKCHENRESMTCRLPCKRKRLCNHSCTQACGEPCNLKPCLVQTIVKHAKCEHSVKVPCYMSYRQLVCEAKCERKLACGHSCPGICSADCSSIACKVKINFLLPSCNHPAERECSTPESQVNCKAICKKPLEGCGHACMLQCCQPCNSERCKICVQVELDSEREQKLKVQQAIRKSAIEELAELRAKRNSPPSVRPISYEDECCDEYLTVHDQVIKFIQPEHGWHPVITKIEKVENVKLICQFLDFKAKFAVDPGRIERKFHGTSAEAVKSIVTDGFKLPPKAGMYGAGIYFATNSSKSSQKIYTKGSNMLLLCDVLIGRTLKVTSATQDYKSHADLKMKGYDSLFAPRNSKSAGGVLFDEYVIFDARQAVPQYIIHYSNSNELPILSLPPSASNHILKLKPSRYKADSASCEALHLAVVQSEYLRIDGTISSLGSITEVWVNRNPDLERLFQQKQAEFRDKYGKDKWIFAFHGTSKSNAEMIFTENFRLDKCTRHAYGRGIYFSEFTHISKDYGDALLLCKVLPGREVTYPTFSDPSNYDCVQVNDGNSNSDYCKMLVISHPDQILPIYRVFTSQKFTP